MKLHGHNGLGFAIVGCGRIGRRHAEQANKFGRLIGVCDIVPERSAELADATEAEPFDQFEAMLESLRSRVDVIAVCTPNNLHSKQTIAAFEAGYHVLCEKPMALSASDCGEMIKAGERANRRLFIVKQNRYNPPVQYLKGLLDAGQLGKIYSAHLNCFWNRNASYYSESWRGTRDEDGGTLYTQFSHFIDVLYWLAGDVREVRAFSDNYCHKGVIEFEDAGVAIIRFSSGAIGSVSFTINSYARNMEGSITLFCECGTVKIGGQYLNVVEYENIRGLEPSPPCNARPPNSYGDYDGSMSNHGEVYANVSQVLTGSGSISTVGFEAMKTVEIIEKIYGAAARAARA